MEYQYLEQIRSPENLRRLKKEELPFLCNEIRDCIVETVAHNGGHLSSNLGAVELTVALHRVFHAPDDAIIFDVGHQSYTHKLLTGRFEQFSSLRKENGLSGFMRPNESPYDPFVTGHSSNSISAAYGILKAKQLNGSDAMTVAVIGDGAMTGGMAYEAMNNAGAGNGRFLVVLNDNKKSISDNVGAMARAFTKLRNRPKYHRFKSVVSKMLFNIPLIGTPIFHGLEKCKDAFKSLVYRNNIFTGMGFNYLGPVDGHNIAEMEDLFRIAMSYQHPCLVHVITTKGKGYAHAENNPDGYHGVSPFDAQKGALPSAVGYSLVAGNTLCSLAENNPKICAVTAAMTAGTGLTDFAERFPERFFDVGIAEQHAVTFSAGLATGGMVPFFAVYSSFLQRGFDQILHDAAIAHLPLKLLIDRAGIVGEDGETHQGVFDVAFLSEIPGMTVYAPSSHRELQNQIESAANSGELCAIRYPRGKESRCFDCDFSGNYTLIGNGKKTAVITYGRLFCNVLTACEMFKDVTVIKLNRVHPIDPEILPLISSFETVHFYEEGILNGGAAEHFAAMLAEYGFKGNYRIHAIDRFVPAATVEESFEHFGFMPEQIFETVGEADG